MNLLKTTLILFLITQSISSQSVEKLEFDKNYFLFGSLSESSGRWKTNKNYEIVDHYYSNEEKIMNKIHCLFKSEYPKIEIKKVNEFNFIINSKELHDKIDSWYIWKLDKEVSNEDNDVFYAGTLNNKLLKTKSQKISFLAGLIERDGKFQNDNIELKMLGSDERYNIIVKILKEFNCKIISDIHYKDNIPNPRFLTFKPNKDILDFLKASPCE